MEKIDETEESPYCDICGTCGYIDCCGIDSFIDEHIKGKTNCKNEATIICELKDLCDYQTDIFKENTKLKEQIDELIKWCEEEIVNQNKSIELLSNKKYADIHIGKITALKEILSKLKGSDIK